MDGERVRERKKTRKFFEWAKRRRRRSRLVCVLRVQPACALRVGNVTVGPSEGSSEESAAPVIGRASVWTPESPRRKCCSSLAATAAVVSVATVTMAERALRTVPLADDRAHSTPPTRQSCAWPPTLDRGRRAYGVAVCGRRYETVRGLPAALPR